MTGKRMLKKNILLSVLFLLFFIPASVHAQESDDTEIIFGSGDVIINDLSDALDVLEQDEGEIRVIVNLELGLEHDVSFDEVSIDEQMMIIQSAQEEFVRELYGGLDTDDTLHNFKYVPAIAMTIDRETLRLIQDSSRVNSIVEDVPLFPTLARSIPVIGADKVWDMGYSGQGQTIAILDTGVDNGHPMFAGKIVDESCFSSNFASHSATSLCPNGSNQQISSGAASPCTGICSHGTHVAGIAAGNKVFSGPVVTYEGVAKDADLVAVQVFTKFSSKSQCDPFNRGWATPCVKSYPSDQIKGLEHVYDLRNAYNISSVNLSLGGGKHTSTCDTAMPSYKGIIDDLRSAGIVSIVASGNDGYTDGISFPACISSAVSVGSTDNSDVISSFSNNDDILDLLAPGDSIRSAIPGTGLGYKGGTSMAAPHVAGAWAVAKSASPTSPIPDILDSFKSTGIDVMDNRLGGADASYKRIQLDNAICDLITCPLPPVDTDGDGVPDSTDNCPDTPNASQTDTDGDGIGDACDASVIEPVDTDGDGVPDSTDNCPDTPNASQTDTDGDGIGDACDASVIEPVDTDGDGVPDSTDNCPDTPNASQTDTDGDGIGDACDARNGGCLIATATYGTELAPQVQLLREIRDNTVMSTASGTAFMTGFNTLYYSFSPTIADWERENPLFQEAVRAFITPMISTLSIMTLAEDGSEGEVLGLGIAVILLNLGIYIAAPAIIVFKTRKYIKI